MMSQEQKKQSNYVVSNSFLCCECGVNTSDIEEYYTIYLSVWLEAAGYDAKRMLCIGCCESRLGRKLTPEDFDDTIVNREFYKSARLKNRMGLSC